MRDTCDASKAPYERFLPTVRTLTEFSAPLQIGRGWQIGSDFFTFQSSGQVAIHYSLGGLQETQPLW